MSDQLSAPRDPGAYSRRRRGLGVGAVVLFGLACLAGGYALANFGPQLYPTKPRTGMAPALSVETFAPPAALPEAPATSAPAPVEA
ncbi:MAG TPA: hypothetical protein VIP08_12415, partial [Phenylobacterium sp.]